MSENQKSEGLRVALPNGSLEEGTLRLFEEAGLKIQKDPRKHNAAIDSPLISRVTFMRPQHIPKLVERGAYDVGICGLDCVCESGAIVSLVTKLLYGHGTSGGQTKVALVASTEDSIANKSEIPSGSVVLSEYPNITRNALEDSCEVRFSYGGTEAHIRDHYRYGVCLTDTGKSIRENGLKVIAVLLESYTCFIANTEALNGEKAETVKTLERLLTGTLEARNMVLLKMNVSADKKDAVLAALPALKTPTVAPLADGKSFAIETVVPKKDANELIVKAAQVGAEGILELPITKVIQNW